MLRRFMIGAAARALWPGCKLDTALMLVGAQGIGKSTFFSILGGPWHSDTFVDITNKDSFVQIHSAWMYELAELENVVHGKAESRLKAWLTSTHDSYRAPYQRTAERRARAVVICGTTNRRQFLTDDTGSRRFWIVPVDHAIDRDQLAHARDQLWAEAVCAAERGEPWWLDAESDRLRELANRDHAEDDEWHDRIAEHLAKPLITETTVGELLEDVLKVEIARQDRWAQMRVSKALVLAGWNRVREAKPPRRWKYVRPGSQLEMS
jgi:predicted P-loop ATPase